MRVITAMIIVSITAALLPAQAYEKDFQVALKKAKETGRPLFVYVFDSF